MGRKKDEPEYVSVLGQWPKVLRDRLRKAVGARQMTATTIAIVEKWLDENEPRLMEERREARRAAEQRRAASAEPPEAGESRAASEVTIEGEQSSERSEASPSESRAASEQPIDQGAADAVSVDEAQQAVLAKRCPRDGGMILVSTEPLPDGRRSVQKAWCRNVQTGTCTWQWTADEEMAG
jgi:hypothetical protein